MGFVLGLVVGYLIWGNQQLIKNLQKVNKNT